MSSPGRWVNQVQFRCEIARNSKNRDSENDRLVRSGGLWSFLGEHWGVLGWFWCFPVMWDAFSGVWISSWTRNFYGQDLGVGIRFRRLHGAGGANHAPRAGSSIAPSCSTDEYFGSSKYEALTPSHHGDTEIQYFERTFNRVLLRNPMVSLYVLS